MQIIPAIDIERGRVARAHGAGAGHPLDDARAAIRAGAAWLHVVDVDRAFGAGENAESVRQIAALPNVAVQVGGGLTRRDDIVECLGWGVWRVVVGAAGLAALPGLLADVTPEHLAIGIDVRDGVAATRGGITLDLSAADIAARAVAAGVTTAVYRDLDMDGRLRGADHEGATRLLDQGIDVILAGGIASLGEIARARRDGLSGVIVGRALSEGRFTLAEAFACLA
ncbi:MAG TPA: HisA/HisF-related TIM barrel protein [Gemmatimonadales bacterium]